MITDVLEEISHMVIAWHFGSGVEPLARVELVNPVHEDSGDVVDSAIQLADRGVEVSSSALMERLRIPQATDDDDALQPVNSNVGR